MFPVFAALVLGELLQEVDTHFRLKAASRLSQGAPMDDHRGAPIILAYVDDVNCLLPHEDVEEFCDMFARLGAKLGAKLNTEKTCILTSTNGTDVPGELLKSSRIGRNSVGASLQRAINRIQGKSMLENKSSQIERYCTSSYVGYRFQIVR